MLRCDFLENGSKRMTRRGARAADSACLESTCAGNGTVGSNPTLSAMNSHNNLTQQGAAKHEMALREGGI